MIPPAIVDMLAAAVVAVMTAMPSPICRLWAEA
jgi:hypothetical protein